MTDGSYRIGHPKMKIMSLFTRPQFDPNLYEFLFLVNTKRRMLGNKQLPVAIDFHSMEKITMEAKGYRQLFGYQHSSKFCVQQKKKEQLKGD